MPLGELAQALGVVGRAAEVGDHDLEGAGLELLPAQRAQAVVEPWAGPVTDRDYRADLRADHGREDSDASNARHATWNFPAEQTDTLRKPVLIVLAVRGFEAEAETRAQLDACDDVEQLGSSAPSPMQRS